MITWTPDRVTLLTKLWGDGLSGAQCALQLGGITRCAAIGKAHRLGLPSRDRGTQQTTPRRRATRETMQVRRLKAKKNQVPRFDVDEIEIERVHPGDNAIPFAQRCQLIELTDVTCRFPVGDPGAPDFFFCGGRAADFGPYCRHHSAVAYRPIGFRQPFIPQRGRAAA